MDLTCFAAGSRRSCAPILVANSLGAVEFIAVIASGSREQLAEAIRRELEAAGNTRLLLFGGPDAARAGAACCGDGGAPDTRSSAWANAACAPGCRRCVLFWTDVDPVIRENPRWFDRVVRSICQALQAPAAPIWGASSTRRVVLIGGEALREHLEPLTASLDHSIRFRYILVE